MKKRLLQVGDHVLVKCAGIDKHLIGKVCVVTDAHYDEAADEQRIDVEGGTASWTYCDEYDDLEFVSPPEVRMEDTRNYLDAITTGIP